jgi:hypothetical protein
MEKFFEGILKVAAAGILAIAVIALIAMVSAFPVKWCWNATMPELFHLPEIGAVKAFCLCWLAGAFIKAAPASNSKD